ncbi:plexin-C1 [Labrus bergylta]|uniref:plexin-C1 n=1 Tax=Labrus bergylta TaxID=56723 RepID=UPI003313E009
MILLPALLILWGEAAQCLEEDGRFHLKGDLRHFAVANGTVYIATEEMLYQLNHDLTLVRSLSQRGFLAHIPGKDDLKLNRSSDMGNVTFSVNVLLPHVADENVIVCGVIDKGCGCGCGYCELLDLKNIANVLYWEQIEVGSLLRSSASVSRLVSVETRTRAETYILTAVQQYKNTKTGCPPLSDAVNLRNTNNNQPGQIFSMNSEAIGRPKIIREDDVEFVDGFQIHSIIYLFSNLPSKDRNNKVRLLWLEGKGGKHQTVKSLRGATLRVSDGEKGLRLIASSVIPGGPPVLWCGVFSVDGGQTNTELVLFDISPDLTRGQDMDPDFCFNCGSKKEEEPKTLKPKKVIFRKNYMTSVLAVRQKNWMVFFIGTGDGQLIKLAVDKKYQTTCSRVLFKTSDDHKVFQTLHLDQVDLKHVYVPFQNQINRVPVSKCSTYKTLQECWSAQDPYCVWCGSDKSCTFEDDCKGSDWLSIPDDSQQKMVSYKVAQENTGQITLTIQMHLSVGESALSNFICQLEHFKMKNPELQFPQCTFILENITFPAQGLPIKLKVGFGTTELLERLNLLNCTKISGPPTSVLCRQCIDAGCGWTTNGCSWANKGVGNDSVCQMMESWMNFSRPQISSITPSVVSFYGRNNAVLKGFNLSSVIRVRFQADCTPQEFPVWDNTGENLTFHIPSAENKGVVKVCLLLPDGSCHGSAKITYRSAPSCTSISPKSTWISGNRKIKLMGSLLELVEAIKHSKVLQEVRLPNHDTYQALQTLTYDSPAATNAYWTFSSTLSLKVANETLPCSTTITYYPDPEFTSFSSTMTGDDVRITIQKNADKLGMNITELSVWGIHEENRHPCIMVDQETNDETEIEFFSCEIRNTRITKFRELEIQYGEKTISLKSTFQKFQELEIEFGHTMVNLKLVTTLYIVMLLLLVLIPVVLIALIVIICWSKQKKFTSKNKTVVEDLELRQVVLPYPSSPDH